MLKSVPDFIEDHVGSEDVIILGLSPSSRTKPFKNGTFNRLQKWCDAAGLWEWDFHNVIPHIENGHKPSDVDVDLLLEKTSNRKKVIALGGIVSRICNKYKIDHLRIDHPSPRNRNLNDKGYELQLIERLKAYIHGTD